MEHTGWRPAVSLDQTVRDSLGYWRQRAAQASAVPTKEAAGRV